MLRSIDVSARMIDTDASVVRPPNSAENRAELTSFAIPVYNLVPVSDSLPSRSG